MKTIGILTLSCVMTLGFAVAAAAHHSAAAFNTQQEVTVKGTISKYTFKNPHVYMTIEVRKADGSTIHTEVEAGAASVLNPLGFTRDSVKVGELVTVTGNPSRNSPEGLVLGKDLYKADGSYLPLNIASRSVYTGKEAVATSIAGTWFPPRTEFTRILGGARGWAVTDKGKAAMSASNPQSTTQKDCIPIGAPALMFYPVASTITVQKDRVILDVDWLDTERIVYLDGRKHPPATQTSLHGYSVGRWEGTTLVVETANFSEHPMGLSTSLPSSTQKRMTERFSLSPDGKTLIYSGTVEDPLYLSKPVAWSGSWTYRPGMPHSNQKCDLEVARRFLKD
jgi:hypothetical protein